MATIYKDSKSDISYYTPTAAEPPKKVLDGLEAARALFSEEEYLSKVAQAKSSAEVGEPISHNFENLSAVSGRADLLAPLARSSRNAMIEMAVDILNEKVSDVDKHIEAVKEATKENWAKIRLWCDVPTKGAGKKKTGETRVPADVLRAIDEKVQEGVDAAAARKAKSDEKKAAEKAAA